MIAWLRTRIDSFLGQGDAAVTVPPMDGALSPNTRLDRADLIAQIPTPNDIAQIVRVNPDLAAVIRRVIRDARIEVIKVLNAIVDVKAELMRW